MAARRSAPAAAEAPHNVVPLAAARGRSKRTATDGRKAAKDRQAPKPRAAKPKRGGGGGTGARPKPRGPADPPPGLDARWRDVWSAYRDQAISQKTWAEIDRPLLDELVRALDGAETAQENANEMPMVEGSTGQWRDNPLYRVAESLRKRALDIAKVLILTPDARAHRGIKLEADEPDALGALLGED